VQRTEIYCGALHLQRVFGGWGYKYFAALRLVTCGLINENGGVIHWHKEKYFDVPTTNPKPEANFKLQTSNFNPQTSNSPQPEANFKLRTSNFKL
jgi:hypothetical protein